MAESGSPRKETASPKTHSSRRSGHGGPNWSPDNRGDSNKEGGLCAVGSVTECIEIPENRGTKVVQLALGLLASDWPMR